MSIPGNESVASGRHVNFKNEAEIRYRTASEDSSTSTIQRKRIKTNSKKVNDIDSGFRTALNFRSYANGSSHLSKYNKKSATENKFDMLLNGKCSWSYKSLKEVSYKKDDEVRTHSFLQVQSSEASVRFSEDNITPINRETFAVRESKSSKNSMESSCSKQNTFNAVESCEIDRDCSYDYDEIDHSTTRKKTRKTVNRRNKNIRNKRTSSPPPSRTLRNKKRISYAGLDSDSYLNSDKDYTNPSSVASSEKDHDSQSGERNGIKRELYENDDSDYSDEGLVLQTRFSDQSTNLLNIASSIENDSTDNFESLEESNMWGKSTTTPLILKLENENKLSNKQTGSLTSNINQKSYFEEGSHVNEVRSVENPQMQPNNNSGSEISSLNSIRVEGNNVNQSETNYGRNQILDFTNLSLEMNQSDNSIDLEADISERCDKLISEIHTKCNELELPQSDDELKNNFDLNKCKSTKSPIYQQPGVKAQVKKSIRENTSKIENNKINDDLTENLCPKENAQTENMIKARKRSNETYPKRNKINKKSSMRTTEIYTIATSNESADKGNINKTEVTGKSKLDKLSYSQTNLVQANFSRNKSQVAPSTAYRNNDELSLDGSIERYELNKETRFEDLSSYNECKNDTTPDLRWEEILKTQAESFNEMFASPVKLVKKTFQRKKFPKKVTNCNNSAWNNITLPLKSKLHSFPYKEKDTTSNILNSDIENNPLEIQSFKNNDICEDDLLDLDPKENLQSKNDWDDTVYSLDQQWPFLGNKNLTHKSKKNQMIKIIKGRQEEKLYNTPTFCYKETDIGINSTSTNTSKQKLKTLKDIKQQNESTSKKKPKTWEDLESELLSETYDLPEKFNYDEKPLVPSEIECNNLRQEKEVKRSNNSWKKRKFDIEGINEDFFLNRPQKNQILAKGIDNNTYTSSEYSQTLVNSPNLNIIDKAIAAMEKCTSAYLSPHKGYFQDGWTKYSDKHDAPNKEYSVSVHSTIIHTTGKKLSVTEATNTYFKSTCKPVEVINKEDQSQLDNYKRIEDAGTSSEDILPLKHQISKAESNNTTGKKAKLENSAQAANASKRSNSVKGNKKSAKITQQSIVNTSSNLNLNISMNKYSEIGEAATFDTLMTPSDEEIFNTSDKNSCLGRSIDKPYSFRKRKSNVDTQDKGKKLKSNEIKVDQVHSYRVSNHEDGSRGKNKNKLASIMKSSQSFKNDLGSLKSKSGQKLKFKRTSIDNDTVKQTYGETSSNANSDKICDEINLCNYSSNIDFTNCETESSHMETFEGIPIKDNLKISLKKNAKQNNGDSLGRIPLNGKALQKNNERYQETKDTTSLETYKDPQYVNYRASNHLYGKLNREQMKKDKIEKQQNSAKDEYVKYLKKLFQSEHSLSGNTQEEDNKNEEIAENNLSSNQKRTESNGRLDGTKLILKDDDLFSISTEESDMDENSCKSEVSQTPCSGLFSDVLDENNA